jgi:6-phosphogluconolactonase (cycloisomerase 2 family)
MGNTHYFGVAEYGDQNNGVPGAAQQFKFDNDDAFSVTKSEKFGNHSNAHCFRYVPQSIVGADKCLALVSDLGHNLVRQFNCTNGGMQEITGHDLPATAARHIDFAPPTGSRKNAYAIVVSEDGDSSDTDRVGSDDDNPPQIHSFVYDSSAGYFTSESKQSTSLLPPDDSWKDTAKNEGSPLYKYLVDNGKFGAKGSDVHVHVWSITPGEDVTNTIVYASTRGYDRIVLFHLDPHTGTLERKNDYPTSVHESKGYTPRTFEIVKVTCDSYFACYIMLVSNQDGGNIALFNIDQFTGELKAADVLQTPFPTSTSAYLN